MTTSVVVLGAGFGGLECATRLAEELGDQVDVTLIDQADAFVFGFSKLDVLFGKRPLADVRIPYSDISRPHVRFRQETVVAIDPAKRCVTTDFALYEADVLVIALGADYDVAATPGLAEYGEEFYSVSGAEASREAVASFTSGTAVVGVCGAPFKCPPAPSETALLLDEFLRARGVRDACTIQLVIPFGVPVPPSPGMSEALLAAFVERDIEFIGGRKVASLAAQPTEAVLDDGMRLPLDLFLGIPVHRAPDVVERSGLAENGWIPVEPGTLATRFPGVYAVGDVTSVGTAKAGVFAEGAARVVADQLIARIRGEAAPPDYDGTAACYVEFGDDEVARVDVDFFSTPGRPSGTFAPPSEATTAEKADFAATRRSRWFGP